MGSLAQPFDLRSCASSTKKMAAGGACFVQTCNQVITGRQFPYERSLEIIQNEEYLEDSDIDEIRRRRYDILKKIGQFNPDYNIPKTQQYNNWMQDQQAQQRGHQNYNYNGKFRKREMDLQMRQNLRQLTPTTNQKC